MTSDKNSQLLNLQQSVAGQLAALLYQDSQQEAPVVQSLSLFFWQNLNRWVYQIAAAEVPFTIALTGPSGSGKSFIREELVSRIASVSQVSAFTQDNYYRDFEADFTHLPLMRFYDEIDFDDPAHIRFRHLARDLQRLRTMPMGSVFRMPRLRFGTPECKPTIIEEDLTLTVTPFVVTEGIHALYDPAILPYYDFKIYVDVDEATRRARWIERNTRENRGITDNMWNTTVRCLREHILPTRSLADLVINNNVPQERVAQFLEELVQLLSVPMPDECQEIA